EGAVFNLIRQSAPPSRVCDNANLSEFATVLFMFGAYRVMYDTHTCFKCRNARPDQPAKPHVLSGLSAKMSCMQS
ncbi:unnamed protein product, partial [Ectocarpus sp. 12 AP-2014]